MEDTRLIDCPAVREHLELVVSPRERRTHNAFFVLCDDAGRPLVHTCVDGVAADPTDEDCTLTVEPFATALARGEPDGRLLAVLTRPGSAPINDVDRRWFHAVHATCRRLGVSVLGVYVVTAYDVVEVHLDDAL